jgi:8-oxo-dGTP pyrophosphatase MutT (NUDIX family)
MTATKTTTTTADRKEDVAATKKYVGSGVILTRMPPAGAGMEQARFLLLLGQETGVWSFPKGHPEMRDRGVPLRTAVRETYEETGFIAGQHYQIVGDSLRFGKRPYWIGVMNETGSLQAPRIQEEEHSIAGWFTLAEAAGLNSNTDVRAWLKKAALPTSGFARTLLVLPRLVQPLALSSTLPTNSSVPACNGS